jgi:hypothetical protein
MAQTIALSATPRGLYDHTPYSSVSVIADPSGYYVVILAAFPPFVKSWISEAYLMTVLETMLLQSPFAIRSFHSDDSLEFVNYTVAPLLNNLLIQFTGFRTRHSNASALIGTGVANSMVSLQDSTKLKAF